MSQVARVFVVLNLIVACGFLFAASTFLALNNDWKGKHEDAVEAHAKAITEKDEKIKEVEKKLEVREREYTAQTEKATGLETENAALRQQVEALRGDVNTRDAQITGFSDQLGRLQEAVNRQQQHIENLETQNAQAQDQAREARAAEMAANQALEAERGTTRELENTVAQKERDINQLTNEKGDLSLMVDFAKQKGIVFDAFPMRAVNGAVVGADAGTKMVMVNVGKSHGVERGYVLDIVRGDRYVGRMRVDYVENNTASGILTITNDTPRTGDRVTNRLN